MVDILCIHTQFLFTLLSTTASTQHRMLVVMGHPMAVMAVMEVMEVMAVTVVTAVTVVMAVTAVTDTDDKLKMS